MLRAFPRTPINVEIKGRTKAEALDEYLTNADALARTLKTTKRRDIIVVSFKQEAVDRFHQLVPALPVAPGIGGAANWLLGGQSPGDGVVAFQLPITYKLGDQTLQITTKDNVARAHREGYAWHTWLSDDGESPRIWSSLLDMGVDGVMTAKPKAFAALLRKRGDGARIARQAPAGAAHAVGRTWRPAPSPAWSWWPSRDRPAAARRSAPPRRRDRA